MEKINFVNDTTPALNATNLNKMQQNVEDVTGDLDDLETSAKSNLVAAINESKLTGGDAVPIYSIFDYDGDTVPTGYEQVDSYSTTEVKTGDTWIDGRPIYRKVVARNETISNGTTISTSGLSINEIIKIKSINKDTNNYYFYDEYYDSSTSKINLHYRPSNNTIEAWTGSGNSFTSTIWIEYTKITD